MSSWFETMHPWPKGTVPCCQAKSGQSPNRRGISLLEVLISMGVLAVGLLSIAAMIPAGRYELMQGTKLDYASMVGRSAFRDLKVRGYLNPNGWRVTSGPTPYTPGPPAVFGTHVSAAAGTPTPAVAIDPFGALTWSSYQFPVNPNPNTLFLTRIYPSTVTTTVLADPIFRSPDDLTLTASTRGADYPPNQQTFPVGGTAIKRASEGNYSWLATIVTDPMGSALTDKVTVSVAVIYKRNLNPTAIGAGEAILNAVPTVSARFGLARCTLTLTNASQALRPAQWIMLAGRVTMNGTTVSLYRWHKVVSASRRSTGTSNTSRWPDRTGRLPRSRYCRPG